MENNQPIEEQQTNITTEQQQGTNWLQKEQEELEASRPEKNYPEALELEKKAKLLNLKLTSQNNLKNG